MDPANTIPARHIATGHPQCRPLLKRKYAHTRIDYGRYPLYSPLLPALRLPILIVTLATLPVLQAADIYKWTDEQGRIHYGDRPEGEQVVQISTSSGPAPDPALGLRQQQQRQLLDVFEKDRQKFNQARADKKAARETGLANCNTARSRLTEMQNARFIYEESKDPDNPLILSEQETAKALATASHDVGLWCAHSPK